jgi:hypothetical protein
MINLYESYQLILLTEKYSNDLYNWSIKEKHFEQYTYRPLILQKSYDQYVNKMINSIDGMEEKNYILVKRDDYIQYFHPSIVNILIIMCLVVYIYTLRGKVPIIYYSLNP